MKYILKFIFDIAWFLIRMTLKTIWLLFVFLLFVIYNTCQTIWNANTKQNGSFFPIECIDGIWIRDYSSIKNFYLGKHITRFDEIFNSIVDHFIGTKELIQWDYRHDNESFFVLRYQANEPTNFKRIRDVIKNAIGDSGIKYEITVPDDAEDFCNYRIELFPPKTVE